MASNTIKIVVPTAQGNKVIAEVERLPGDEREEITAGEFLQEAVGRATNTIGTLVTRINSRDNESKGESG